MLSISRLTSLILVLFSLNSTLLAQDQDIVDTAIGAGSFNTLVTAVQVAGLEDALRGTGPFTVFAPTDDAFAAVPSETLDFLLANPDELQKVLLYHVVSGAVPAATVVTIDSAETLLGESVTVTVDGSSVKVNDANVIATDIAATNGIIHVIDSVLLPPIEEGIDIVDTAIGAGDFNTLVAALQATGLDDALRGAGPFTVFAPNDAAFAKLGEDTINGLLANPDALAEILLFHVVAGSYSAADVLSRNQLPTLEGTRAGISLDGDSAQIENATIIATDIGASNGIIHVIDSVIIPTEAEGITYEVTITNGTSNHVFTPPLLVAHRPNIAPFQLGGTASDSLKYLAEEGNAEEMVDDLFPLDSVTDLLTGTDPIPPGGQASYTIKAAGPIDRISVLSMLATTNDTFLATTVTPPRVLVFKSGSSSPEVVSMAFAYDAGTEYNSESCAHIPGPPCGSHHAAPDQPGEGLISFARGIRGDGDLSAMMYDWRGPVATVVVRALD
jgi:uncharacterized surface protein with fasciclin (FAS1) repeats